MLLEKVTCHTVCGNHVCFDIKPLGKIIIQATTDKSVIRYNPIGTKILLVIQRRHGVVIILKAAWMPACLLIKQVSSYYGKSLCAD